VPKANKNILNAQLSVGDLEMSPIGQSPFGPKNDIDSFRLAMFEEAKNEMKNFIITNEDGIERRTYYQDD
jgi:hypothetical protein